LLLGWDAKEVADKNFRIRFRRHPNAAQPDAPADTAFYFDNEADVYFLKF